MGLINQCMLNQEKSRVPSQIGDVEKIQQDINYYRNAYQNSPRYNDYLVHQGYRTQIIQPSEKNSSVYQKMNKCSQPPSQVFNQMKWAQQQSKVNQEYIPVKIRRTNQCQSQTVNRPKIPRRSAQPLSYQPMKVQQKDSKQKTPNQIQETIQTDI